MVIRVLCLNSLSMLPISNPYIYIFEYQLLTIKKFNFEQIIIRDIS